MRITTTITLKEKVETINGLDVDPCSRIECANIDCETCPLREAAEALRKAQNAFLRLIDECEVEVENEHNSN